MLNYLIRRLFMMIIVLFIVSIIVFVGMRVLPGDPIRMIVNPMEQQGMDEEQIQQLKHEYGLDKPMVVQYVRWIGGVLHGDFGVSIYNRSPVAEEILRRLPITLHIGLSAFFLGIIIGIPSGIVCAVRRGKWIDTLLTTLANIGITMPLFWFGVMLMFAFGLYLKWLPAQGYISPFENLGLSIKMMIMPVICLGIFPIAAMARQTRSSMLEVLSQDYIRTAWSKGLREKTVICKHALKNALIPVITISGMGLSMVIGGSVIAETVFNIPGMGRLLVGSVLNQDYPYVQGIILIVSAFIVFINLVIDLAYGWINPQIKFN